MRFQVVDEEGVARSRPCSSRDVAALLAALDEENGIEVRIIAVDDDGLPCPPAPSADEIALVKSGASVRGWRLIRGARRP